MIPLVSVLLLGVMMSLTPTRAIGSTVYENAESGHALNWKIVARGSRSPSVRVVRDKQSGSNVIEFDGTRRDAFEIGGSRRWGNVDERFLSWEMRADDSFLAYVVVYTDNGRRVLRYRNSAVSKLGYKAGYVDHGLGDSAADGSWQTHVRDLQADLAAAEPGNRIVAVNGFLFRGRGRLDDLALHRTLAEATGDDGSAPRLTPVLTPAPMPLPTPTPTPTPGAVPTPVQPLPSPVPTHVSGGGRDSALPVAENGRLLAFPGAEGHGRFAKGGRNGRVVIVDTLADVVANDGKTSLREALETMKGPRTIVFAVGGTFDLGKRNILMDGENDSYVTLACQSAPSPGVLIRSSGIRIRGGAHDIVMRHCAIRNVDPGKPLGESSRTIAIVAGSKAGSDLIFDHMSLGWATDEGWTAFVASKARADLKNITLSRSIIAEGDADSSHPESGQLPRRYLHAMGPSCASASTRYRAVGCSIIGNLMAHNGRRNPLMWGASGEVANNVIFNWHETALDARPHRAGRLDLHVWGNLFKAGPTTRKDKAPMVLINVRGQTHLRVSDNTHVQGGSTRARALKPFSVGTPGIKRNAVSPFSVRCVGATRPTRDAWDERIISEYRGGRGVVGISTDQQRVYPRRSPSRHPASHDTDRDGMADSWEREHGLDPNDPTDHRSRSKRTGLTAIEGYLSDLADC